MATLATQANKSGALPASPNGTKRICGNCSAKFYDFHKLPVICPKCGTMVFVGHGETEYAGNEGLEVIASKEVDLDDFQLEANDESLDELETVSSIEDLEDFDELDDVDSLEEVEDHHENPEVDRDSDDADDSMFADEFDSPDEIHM